VNEAAPAVVKAKRVRRTADEAKRVILDAAEAQMMRVGPAGIRLQELAAEIGIAHSTILHHFTNRAGLVRALNQRTFDHLRDVVLQAFAPENTQHTDVIGAVFDAFGSGLAQRMAWLVQAHEVDPGQARVSLLRELADALHVARLADASPGAVINKADSEAVAYLVTVAAFGHAFLGERQPLFKGPGDDDRRFERWLAELISEHFQRR
jgi:AcrR family transcriptional regulator